MSDYGIKISKDGHAVGTAGILDQSFNSEKNCLKIAIDGLAVSEASGTRTIEVNHGLGLTPCFMVWFMVGTTNEWNFMYGYEKESGLNCGVNANSDGTSIYLNYDSNGTASISAYYIGFVDPGD